jgi:hypothetical protein
VFYVEPETTDTSLSGSDSQNLWFCFLAYVISL